MGNNRLDEPRVQWQAVRWVSALVVAGLLAGCSALPGAVLPPSASAVSSRSGSQAAGAGGQGAATGSGAVLPDPVAGTAPVPVAPPAPSGPATPSQPAGPDLSGLQKQIGDYLEQQSGTYGVYVIDLASGKSFGVNADTVFPAASTFKLPMCMYILDQVEQGNGSLDEKLAYTDADYEEGTGALQGSIGDGDRYSIRDLIQYAIEDSDNIAANMLLDRFGRENVYDYMHQLGGKVTTFDDPENGAINGTTPREMASYMRLLYGKKAIQDSQLRQFLLDLLSHTAFTDRTEAGVPSGVRVAHKIGTLPNVVNDVALVYAPQRTFVVAVYSMEVEEDPAADVIANVTRMVYDFEHAVAVGAAK